jgi:hypothetical protein
METVYQVLIDRAERGMGDLLLTIYDHAYCAGANLPSEAPTDANLRDLLSTLAGRHRAEVLALRGWIDPPIAAEDLPGWLLAHYERQTALGDAEPPDGFETAPPKRV